MQEFEKGKMDRSMLAQLWWELMQIPVGDFFAGHPERMVAGSSLYGATVSPGYVGRNYGLGGWLLVGNYPAGGTASYIERPNPTDQRLYGSFTSLAAADTAQTRLVQFETMSATWIELQRTHHIYRTLFLPLFRAAAKTDEDVAFLNAFPFRCRDNNAPSIGMYANAWRLAVSLQIEALQPARIVALGLATGRAIERFHRGSGELIVLERSNGDRYLKESAQKMIATLALEGGATQHDPRHKPAPAKGQLRQLAVPTKEMLATASDRGENPPIAQPGIPNRQPSVAEYQRLFERLGLKATRGHTLKRGTQKFPSLYFNYKADQEVFFTGYKSDLRFYPADLWERLGSQQAKDNQPKLMTVRPKVGQASAALEDWVSRS